MEITGNTGQVVDETAKVEDNSPSEMEKELVSFVVDHTDRWREYRDQNHMDNWDKYERIFRGQWDASDKHRDSERSRVISPATQQAIETRHAEVMEAIFGQGEYFDIKDDLLDQNQSKLDVERLKNQLYEDFSRDKIRKSVDQIELMAEIYGTGIGEVVIGYEPTYVPAQQPMPDGQLAYGVNESERFFVRLNPINPKNFLFDPNGTSIDDCMGVAIERYVSIHKISKGIADGKYRDADIGSMYEDDSLESDQEKRNYEDDKVKLLTYYGLVPREYLDGLPENEEVEMLNDDLEDYADMVEAIIIIANGEILLKAEESPYMMKDRPIISYQDDTIPNRLLGRGTAEKAYNMQAAIDAQMRSHLDSLAMTNSPMVAVDATRLPRGAKFEVKPGKAFMTNGDPNGIIMPFKFGTNDGMAMQTSKEFERMLLMATGTLDSNGMVTAGSRDAGGLAPAVAGIIKKYKRTLVNFQEDFLIPFVNKAAWRYMQYDPERYPSVDVKFMPTATLGIIAREYEQQQMAFLIQTLGNDSPMAPILMQGLLQNSSFSNREQMLEQIKESTKPDMRQQQIQMVQLQKNLELIQAQINEFNAKAQFHTASAQKTAVDSQLAPKVAEAKYMTAVTTNLPNEDDKAEQEFQRRVKITELALKEEEVKTKKAIVEMQMQDKKEKQTKDAEYLDKVQQDISA